MAQSLIVENVLQMIEPYLFRTMRRSITGKKHYR